VELSLKLAHSVPNRDTCGGCGGRQPLRGMDRCYRLYVLLVSRRLGLDRIIRVTHGVCKHSRYSEVLLAGARGFYLSLLERVFHVKILCLHAVISFSFFVIAYRFYNTPRGSWHCYRRGATLLQTASGVAPNRERCCYIRRPGCSRRGVELLHRVVGIATDDDRCCSQRGVALLHIYRGQCCSRHGAALL
jgi:hypothetical protein